MDGFCCHNLNHIPAVAFEFLELANLRTAGWLTVVLLPQDRLACQAGSNVKQLVDYYSPGICPTGYSAACSSFCTASGVTETVATCCPTGYTCFSNRATDQLYGCSSSFWKDETLTIKSVLFDTVTAASTTSYPIVYASTTMTARSGLDNVAAYGIVLKRATDDPTWESNTASTSTSSPTPLPIASDSTILVSASLSSSTSLASTSTSTSSPRTGLSTGAKAHVAVGVLLGILLIGAGVFFLFKRLPKRPQGLQSVPVEENIELTHHYGNYNNDRQYDIPTHVVEAPVPTSNQQGGELHGDSIRTPDIQYELPGSPHQQNRK
ncbi:hypothetical protein EYC84_009454 [Monilinia fructicola]|uniref:Mid2 domain-containing protein n=1 Tax=Monilinia fructicola TaxID=38448 RepID=A0A5M9JCI9_MONFR|nr:hypothetical protein EYC84_009454 [Monilinia fructicola]